MNTYAEFLLLGLGNGGVFAALAVALVDTYRSSGVLNFATGARYESPSPVQARYVASDVEHHGQNVPAGSIMLALTASANRDERRFPDPDRFDIHRNIGHHVAFGYGIHFCLGAALARLEGRVALDEVLQRFPSWEIDCDKAGPAHTSTVRGWEKLPVWI